MKMTLPELEIISHALYILRMELYQGDSSPEETSLRLLEERVNEVLRKKG